MSDDRHNLNLLTVRIEKLEARESSEREQHKSLSKDAPEPWARKQAKILDDLAEKLAARQIQLAQSNTQHKGIFVSVLQIFLKALGEVRTEHFGEREK